MIEIKRLCKSYEGKSVFQQLNLEIEENAMTSITGESGCGKTTLLRLIAGLEEYEAGQIKGIAGSRISYVFQEDRLMPWLNVRENIEYVLEEQDKMKKNPEKIRYLLQMLKIEDCENKEVSKLSGGMQRRVAIARALAYESEILLLDEPFKGLDEQLKWHVLEGIKSYLKKSPRTVICVTHDLEIARTMTYTIDLQQLITIK